MRRADWTPAVLVTATVSVTVVLLVLLARPWILSAPAGSPGPERPRRDLPAEVTIWVGELDGGVKAVLGAVYGATLPDRVHDDFVNEGLALGSGRRIGYYRLLLFNLGDEERRLRLGDGALTIHPAAGGDAISSLDLGARIRGGALSPPPALESVLQALGALAAEVVVPGGEMASLLLAFGGRVELEDAASVETADGAAFRRRRMSRRDLEALIETPDEKRVQDL